MIMITTMRMSITMLEPFLIRAALAGLAVAIAAGPLGAFVVWRRMAFFGDAMAHASVLGVAFALLLSLPVSIGTFLLALGLGALLARLQDRETAGDTALGVLAYSALALGLVLVSFIEGVRVNIEALLFGDILTASWFDVGLIWAGATAILALILWRWSRLLTVTLNPELAVAAGINPRREDLIITIALALLIAMALKIVGALLITAMLVIPNASARLLSRTPEAMAYLASVLGSFAVLGGLVLALWQDTPAGPSIVVAATGLYVLALSIKKSGH
jgi:zinc transport system permease protein